MTATYKRLKNQYTNSILLGHVKSKKESHKTFVNPQSNMHKIPRTLFDFRYQTISDLNFV